MKKPILFLILLLLLPVADVLAQGGSGVYVGGHIRRERPNTITTLRNSGFTYVILFNVSVETDGTLTTDGETICRNGEYVFANQQPHYVEDVKALKAAPTAIQRIDICIGGWGNESYDRIKTLIDQQGTGEESILYRNFKALKEAIPEIDGVNNDDEHCYNAQSAAQFHAMMYTLGYRTSIAPYTYKSFWQNLLTMLHNQHPGACDLVMIQCYDGGASNNPSDWHLQNIPLHAGRTNYQTDMQTSINQMQAWHDNNGVTGGFVWVYNDETWKLNEWAANMNRVFISHEVSEPACTFYTENNFGGYKVSLPEGAFSTGLLSTYGLADKSVCSFELQPGYQLTTYLGNEFTGSQKIWTDASMARMGTWGRRLSSLKIEKINDAIVNTTVGTQTTAFYSVNGVQRSEPQSGLNIIRTADGNVRVVMKR